MPRQEMPNMGTDSRSCWGLTELVYANTAAISVQGLVKIQTETWLWALQSILSGTRRFACRGRHFDIKVGVGGSESDITDESGWIMYDNYRPWLIGVRVHAVYVKISVSSGIVSASINKRISALWLHDGDCLALSINVE